MYAIVPAMNESERGTPEPEADFVCVFRTGDEGLAGIVKSILDGEDIFCMARGAEARDLFGAGRAGGSIDFAVGPVDFLVRPQDAERARAVLDALRQGFLSGGAAEPEDAGDF